MHRNAIVRDEAPDAWPPPKPPASDLSDYEWHQQAQLARHYAQFGEPCLSEERCGHLRLTWRLEEGKEARLERLAVLDPDANRGARTEGWVRDRVVETIGGVPHVALPLVVAITAAIVVLTHAGWGVRIALLVACGLAALLIAPLVWRTRRLWRVEECGSFSPPQRERERELRALAAEHADAWRSRDAAACDAIARRLWAELPRD